MNLSQSFTQSQSIPSSWLWIFISFWDIQVSGQVPRKASPHMLPFSQIATIGKKQVAIWGLHKACLFQNFSNSQGQWLRTQVVFFVFSHVFPFLAPLAPSALASLWAHSAASSATLPRSPGPWRNAGVAPERRNAVGRRGRWRHLGRQTEMFWDGPSTISWFINHYHNPH